jgi:hypothetical protein
MPPYPLLCYSPGCGKPAEYKIAAQWSNGLTSELKTYGLTCGTCLSKWFQRACERQRACRLAPGETLSTPNLFRLERGLRDQYLVRLRDLEDQLTALHST